MNFAERLDPRLKIFWCVFLIIAAFTFATIPGELAIIAVMVLMDALFTKSLKKYKVLVVLMLLVASQIFVIQFLFCRQGHLIWQWGIIKVYSDFWKVALLGTLRTSAIAMAAIQCMTWTSSKQATLMLVSWHVPYRYAMLTGVAARFLPLMQKEYLSICDSQTVRGLPCDGVWNKVKTILPTFFPFLYRAIRRSSETALSMELRGFGREKTRTFTTKLDIKPWERIALGVVILMILLLCAQRVLSYFI
ncbi:MAG: energy-coupling factor transporter transmembrane component T [Bacillota bacterium]|nr:energy-coupling factor transporter transmembrane component T [Bacillota bacterium]